MTNDKIKELITAMGFAKQPQSKNIWSKKYSNHDDYVISLDFDKSAIDYGNKINRGDDTTSNFSNDENFVVLECIDRLLTKGYKPQDLTLEKKWKLGRSAKSGKADINVTDGKTGKTVLIIECKTWGTEFEKEKDRMKETGGQLFSYFQQNKAARFLCLYTSQLTANLLKQEKFIDYKTAIVKVEDTEEDIRKQDNQIEHTLIYQKATDVAELVKVWHHKNKKQFDERGIFEEEVEPYNPGFVPLRVANLKEFNQDDAKTEYYKFEEILRHNNISDRSNAFNRFISLVLAKIVDEEKPANGITEFQIKKGVDTSEELIERLQTLYAKAMRDYLGETVINYTFEEIEQIISHFPRQTSKEDLKRIYRELKFYTNNEFSFKEIYNRELFEQNAKVLFEVVDRLQYFRFKYNAKAQFLGDFFEDMLESGFKQSEGQFFTPTPIAKFIVSAIPLREIIEEKIKNKEPKILPSVIDYACGSGHFITEAIEEIQQLVKSFDNKAHKDIASYKETTKWAADYICGIEKDYRLARTSQVACFMHGDGDAKIIFGDGLEEHLHRLPQAVKRGENFLGFDVLVANPPYTIKDFKKHLNKERLPKYELLQTISDDSDDIEVMFVERTKQLLKDGGFAGIFLPSTILNSTGIYTKAREIILKYFEIKGIVEFGSNTFSATSTNTIVLFMKRRSEKFAIDMRYIAEDLILGYDFKRHNDWVDNKKLLRSYVELLNLNYEDYITLLFREPNANIQGTEFYQSYLKWFENLTEVKNFKKSKAWEKMDEGERRKNLNDNFLDNLLEIECEKFEYFLLAHIKCRDESAYRLNVTRKEKSDTVATKEIEQTTVYYLKPQQTLIIKSGKDNETQKAFLGYTFSDRRGYKGLDMKKDASGKEITKLYDKDNLRNPEKANTYIYKAFKEEAITEIPETLKEHITPINLVDTFDFLRVVFDKQIYTSQLNTIGNSNSFKWPVKRVEDVLIKIKGDDTKVEKGKWKQTGKYPVISQEVEFISGYVGAEFKPISDIPVIAFGDHTKIFKYIDFPFVRGADGVRLLKPNNDFIPKAFYYICQILRIEGSQKYSRHFKFLSQLAIPVPPKDVQDRIVKEIEKVEKDESKAISQKQNAITKIETSIRAINNQETIGNIAKLRSEKVEPQSLKEETGNYIGLEHIESNTAKLVANWQPTINATIKSTKNKFYKGDLLYGKLRPYLNKVWIAEFEGYCSTDILVLQTESPIVLKRILLSEDFVKRTTSLMKGMSLPRLEVKQFKEMKIQYPLQVELKNTEKSFATLDKEIMSAEEVLIRAVERKMEILKTNLK